MRLRYLQNCVISSSPGEEKDLGNTMADTVVDSMRDGGTMRFRIPASAANVNVQHSQVALAGYVSLRAVSADPTLAPVELTVRRNSPSGDAWPLTPLDGKAAHLQMSTSGLTALYVSNPGAVDMMLTVSMCGD